VSSVEGKNPVATTMVRSPLLALPPAQQHAAARRTAGIAHRAALSPTDRAARAALIMTHQPLVRYVVGRLRYLAAANSLLEFEDLLGYGTEGLIAAIDTFDPEHGAQFSTWAVMKIRTAVLDAVRALDPVSRTTRQRSRAIDHATAELAQAGGHWPTRVELAAALDEPVAQLEQTLQELERTAVASLDRQRRDAAGEDDGGLDLHDRLVDDDPKGDPATVADRTALHGLLAAAIAALPERERLLVIGHYQDGRSLRLIGVQLGVSESRMSQLHTRALRRLREHLQQALDDSPPSGSAPQAARWQTPRQLTAVLRQALLPAA
jgi:RNA polymerase sigma factor for flagellar operon FliA